MSTTYLASVYADNHHKQLDATFAIELADPVVREINRTKESSPDETLANLIHAEPAAAFPGEKGFWIDPPVLERCDNLRDNIDRSKAVAADYGICAARLDNISSG